MNGWKRVGRIVIASLVAGAGAHAFAQQVDRATQERRRESWQKVDEIFKAMGIQPGSAVADIGAGGGFFTVRLSRAVGSAGRVYAVDVSAKVLAGLKRRVADEQLANVDVIEGAADDPKLPAGALDAALIVNAYHEMAEHDAMLAKIKAALKPDGRLVIVEPIAPARRDAARADQTRSHEIAVEHVQQDARAAGFRVVALQDPFTSRTAGRDEEWLLVLTPSKPVADAPTPPAGHTHGDTDDWRKPELRIAVDDFRRLLAANQVVVVDVRDDESFRRGHLPGAILITPEEIGDGNGAERLRGERRPIVTYCS